MSPMDMDVGDDLILGWYWISSHDLRHLYADGRVHLRSGPRRALQLDLLPAAAGPPPGERSPGNAHPAGDHSRGVSQAPPTHRAAGAFGAGRTTRAERPRRTPSTNAASPLNGVEWSTLTMPRSPASPLPRPRKCRRPAPGASQAAPQSPCIPAASPRVWTRRCSRTVRSSTSRPFNCFFLN